MIQVEEVPVLLIRGQEGAPCAKNTLESKIWLIMAIERFVVEF